MLLAAEDSGINGMKLPAALAVDLLDALRAARLRSDELGGAPIVVCALRTPDGWGWEGYEYAEFRELADGPQAQTA